ncbi:uncharacterized protein LOC112508013 [Cynara cardunculus var. scolymus]|uniref:Pathogenic type III effector avirulence factor Avr cleavage site-containing protein n=1 Tax=Cynara cardunculus var. scolymus TaxID=59895 RepID=A0A103YLY6_CYNCS|nr:uncharacterized protein LOC112508013 [Cynara cardunculus var. scolymus]KVI11532.1 hypothetical protein Ccrd_010057 [Cynara cardunculus var. scolymus]
MTYYRRNQIPAFGSWNCNDDLPFTQCFESATQPGLISCSYTEDRDLYVAGDLYRNNIVTPAIIVAPRRRGYTKEVKKDAWVANCDCDEKKEAPTPVARSRKAVDEDLYKISPELLRAKPRRRRWGWFSSCMLPACVV